MVPRVVVGTGGSFHGRNAIRKDFKESWGWDAAVSVDADPEKMGL